MPAPASTIQLLAAFAAIYFIWGSTYLGIKLAIESLPPWFMAGSRFLLAGCLLLGWLAVRGHLGRRSFPGPTLLTSAIVGVLMLGVGNGLVVHCIQRGAPTGLIAVLIAITPFWLVGIERLVEPSRRITVRVVAGLLLGVVGIAVLGGVLGWTTGEPAQVDAATLGTMLVATLGWACGSMLSRYRGAGSRHRHLAPRTAQESTPKITPETAPEAAPSHPLLPPALQMIAGGSILLLTSALVEPWSSIDPGAMTWRAWAGYVYLILFGSIVAYSAFIWLLRHVSAAAVGTYAYVNPVVAVVLGALVLDERLTIRTGIASALILAAVALITWPTSRPARATRAPATGEPCTSTRS